MDAIGVGAGLAWHGTNGKNLLAVLERRGGLPAAQALAKMGRATGSQAIQDALNQARRNPESAKILDQALQDTLSAKTVRRVAENTVIAARNPTPVSDVIADDAARRLRRAIIDVISSVDSPIASGRSWGQLIHVVGLDVDEPIRNPVAPRQPALQGRPSGRLTA